MNQHNIFVKFRNLFKIKFVLGVNAILTVLLNFFFSFYSAIVLFFDYFPQLFYEVAVEIQPDHVFP